MGLATCLYKTGQCLSPVSRAKSAIIRIFPPKLGSVWHSEGFTGPLLLVAKMQTQQANRGPSTILALLPPHPSPPGHHYRVFQIFKLLQKRNFLGEYRLSTFIGTQGWVIISRSLLKGFHYSLRPQSLISLKHNRKFLAFRRSIYSTRDITEDKQSYPAGTAG